MIRNYTLVKSVLLCLPIYNFPEFFQEVFHRKALYKPVLLRAGADVEKVVEKGKSQFVGPELMGKTLGVIGLGAIGVMVANAAVAMDMDVIGYDPFLSVDAALRLSRSVKLAKTQTAD